MPRLEINQAVGTGEDFFSQRAARGIVLDSRQSLARWTYRHLGGDLLVRELVLSTQSDSRCLGRRSGCSSKNLAGI